MKKIDDEFASLEKRYRDERAALLKARTEAQGELPQLDLAVESEATWLCKSASPLIEKFWHALRDADQATRNWWRIQHPTRHELGLLPVKCRSFNP